ncbi:mechanosensitive ion channel family protein [Polyangium jinanense]|uniref:Mechanosensitive ion channel n=1 Tax=Polyangium jinanense TaxID=2829994 RepID=A0A9X3XFH0_9BACT|nr:mechanosensitive ion channel domain-containing protein [Polyangium jinanense]MDC3958459.1 mechanosensitive ion channel [Polyangium jinanense]MDC3989312.1 mechanosensitive ion channel [Polyangium jinanense]
MPKGSGLLIGALAAASTFATEALAADGGVASAARILHRGTPFGLLVWQGLVLLVAPVVGWICGTAGVRLLAKLASRTDSRKDDRLVAAFRGPCRLILAVLFVRAGAAAFEPTAETEAWLGRILSPLLVIGCAWAADRALGVGVAEIGDRYEASKLDAVSARAARTRLSILRQVASVLLALVAAALVLLQFDLVRQVGVSLLASAGIAGVVLGFAAQRTLATILAGLQISIAQPVRIGDEVVIEGEWGTVEEITLTFVVVRIWDQRRLVLPISHFLDKPFQNWTRSSSELLGTVFLHVDYMAPIDVLREEVRRACEEDPDWDGKVAGLVVVDALETTVKLRALVSAASSGKLWDLRCRVRERLVRRLQGLDGGRYLPRGRFEPAASEEKRSAEMPREAVQATPLPQLLTPPKT